MTCAPGAQGLGASTGSRVALWSVFGFRLALPHKRQHLSAFVLRRSILSIRRHSVEQKHEPRATLFSGIKTVQRVQ
jgi:hypothetical protein